MEVIMYVGHGYKIIPVFKSLLARKCIVCVEVLQFSQPNGVISSTVSLPNNTFTGQA